METWFDAVKKYPFNGTSATIILVHLSFGPDYPYHMSNLLKTHIDKLKEMDIDIRGLGSLSYPNLMSEFLKKMALDEFIVPDHSIISKNKRDYYKINPAILNSPIKPSPDFIPKKFIPDRLILELLDAMYLDRSKRYMHYRYKIQRINFFTFLEILQRYALKYNMNIIAGKLGCYIYETMTQKEITLVKARTRAFLKIRDSNPRRKEDKNTIETSMGTFLLNADEK
jgi:hypothetical protein